MKLCLITDMHFGIRGDNLDVLKYQEQFFNTIFFPYIDAHEINTIIDLGDTFDRRKYLNYLTFSSVQRFWFNPIKQRNIQLHILLGNHTTYYKNSSDIHSLEMLSDYFKVYAQPTTLRVDNRDILLLPWINEANYQQSLAAIKDSKSALAIGHLEIAGFEMFRGSMAEHGADRSLFNKFDMVLSGHFHHKSHQDNITYLGTPFEMTWADYGDQKGFHILDTETLELQFIANPYKLFQKIEYDDSDTNIIELSKKDYSHLAHSYCKVVVVNKTNPYWFDLFIDQLEKVGIIDLQVVETSAEYNMEDDQQLFDQIEDITTMLNKAVSQFSTTVSDKDKKNAKKILRLLYNQALLNEVD